MTAAEGEPTDDRGTSGAPPAAVAVTPGAEPALPTGSTRAEVLAAFADVEPIDIEQFFQDAATFDTPASD